LNNPVPFTEDDLPKSLTEIKNGYIKSKWICENMIRRMQGQGFPCSVYRPGLIFSKKTMITLAGDFIWRIFRTSLIMGQYPDSGINLLLAPVDTVSCAMVESIRSNQTGKVYHLFETQTRFRDLSIEAIGLGYALEPVSTTQWHDLSIKLFNTDPSIHPLSDYLNAYDIKVIELMTVMSEYPIPVSCSKTHDLLSSMGIPEIKVSGEVLKACILELQKAKIIPSANSSGHTPELKTIKKKGSNERQL
jgi:thioester reductase-like protein